MHGGAEGSGAPKGNQNALKARPLHKGSNKGSKGIEKTNARGWQTPRRTKVLEGNGVFLKGRPFESVIASERSEPAGPGQILSSFYCE